MQNKADYTTIWAISGDKKHHLSVSFQSNNNANRQETWLKQDETMLKFHDLDLILPISTSLKVLKNDQ